MSFLQDIQNCRTKLNKVETVVTCVDGKRYVETNSSLIKSNKIMQQSTCGYIVDTTPDDIPAQIISFLYLGSQDCCSPDVLTKYNIKSVLSLGIEAPFKAPDISHIFVPCLDLPETDLEHIIMNCNKIIRKSIDRKENILVHCNAGVSRSVSIIIGFLILEKHKSYEDAYQLVKLVRPCMQPNAGFVKQLKNLHETLYFTDII